MKSHGVTPTLQLSSNTSSPDGRAYVVIDVENLAGTGWLTPAMTGAVAAAVAGPAPGIPPHLRTVGCDAGNALDVKLAFPGDRLVTGRGPDGADFALLNAIDVAHTAGRFDRLVICSGDGAFAPLAAKAARRGLEVIVVTGYGKLNRRLLLAAHAHVSIERDLAGYGEAA